MTVAATATARKRTTRAGPQPDALLAWYDRHRRVLPWRARPGETPDPYRVWLSEIMLQQTTVKAVAPYYIRFLARWPDVQSLAAAPLDDVLKLWAGLGYYARARNLHACARAVAARGGFPSTQAELAQLPGIGRYTAAAIAAIAFDAPGVPVDGNVERVVSRLFAVEGELPKAKPDIHRLAQTLAPAKRAGDFAQALMDLGATICGPQRPACVLCPWMQPCAARQRGDPETFPRKAPKREGRLRRGASFVLLRADGFLLVRTRAPNGLLGGMAEVPSTPWSEGFEAAHAMSHAPRLSRTRPKWRRLPGVVTHGFTHFPLEQIVFMAEVPAGTAAPEGSRWVSTDALHGEAWPNVMRKVLVHALGDDVKSKAKRKQVTSPARLQP